MVKFGEMKPPTAHDVLLARRRIKPYLKPTPIFTSPMLDEALGFETFVKCENLQPTGAFKVRGGINLFSVLPQEVKERGVITASSGNHGQSIAYAGDEFDVYVSVHVPAGTNPLKIEAMETMGAEVVEEGKDYDEAREMAEERAEEEGLYYVHGANEPFLIAGVGTAYWELLEEVPDLDVILVPIGGGSGACGAAAVIEAFNPDIELIGVQSEGADAVYRSWRSGRREADEEIDTFAEGIATRVPFELPFQILAEHLDDFVLVSDAEMEEAIRFLLDMTHLVAEGAGAAATAAARKMKERLAGKKVGLMLSGGNFNLDKLRGVLC